MPEEVKEEKQEAQTKLTAKEVLKLNQMQRNWLSENFKDELQECEVSPGERFFKRIGPNIQALLRDSVIFHCLYAPIEAEKRIEKNGKNDIVYYTVSIDLEVPGVGHRFVLKREFPKEALDKQ